MVFFKNELDEVVLQWKVTKMQNYRKAELQVVGQQSCSKCRIYRKHNYLSEVPSVFLDIIESKCKRYQLPCYEDVYNVLTILSKTIYTAPILLIHTSLCNFILT